MPALVAQSRKSLAAVRLACVAARLWEVWVQTQAPATCRYMQINKAHIQRLISRAGTEWHSVLLYL